jgi:hypothetical protein
MTCSLHYRDSSRFRILRIETCPFEGNGFTSRVSSIRRCRLGVLLCHLTFVSSDVLARLMEQSVGRIAMILKGSLHSILTAHLTKEIPNTKERSLDLAGRLQTEHN